MTFRLSRVSDRQNQFPSILPFEVIMFQSVKREIYYILFCYGISIFASAFAF